MKIEFKEEQKFTQWWLWIILVGIGLLPLIMNYQQLVLKEDFGDRPMSDFGLILFSIFIFVFIILFLSMRLKTTIDLNQIEMKFSPFVSKKIRWNNVKSAEVINYGFVGGWGIRPWTPFGTVYNIKGNKGLAIELSNGKKFLIGTQKSMELNKALEDIKRRNSRNLDE